MGMGTRSLFATIRTSQTTSNYFIKIIPMNLNFRENAFRLWYWYVNKIDRNAEVLFMNYGFDDNQDIPLDNHDITNRYSIQLYHHLASATNLKDKDIVEVGCGRGGGLSYLTTKFSPSSAKGVDLNKQAVSFCNRHYNLNGLTFIQGNAENLSLESNSCDVVINVESSHRYPNMAAFLSEVKRILRPNGYFLFTDFRFDTDMNNFKRDLEQSGLVVLNERNINEEVLAALNLDDARRRDLVKRLTPKYINSIALNFAGVKGSKTYNNFVSRKYIYFSYILQKA
jgi:ubiquinone/menaquinone biosynthesis C-methylase UbiE